MVSYLPKYSRQGFEERRSKFVRLRDGNPAESLAMEHCVQVQQQLIFVVGNVPQFTTRCVQHSVPLQVVLRVHNACQLPLASCNHAEGICARRCADWNDLKHTPNNEHANQIRKGPEETHRQGFHGSEHYSVKVTKAHGISHQSVGCDMHLFTRVLRL